MSRKILSHVQTDIGRRRDENEDNFVWVEDLWNKSFLTLIGAIDGVGGYDGGAEAAAIAKSTVESYLQNLSFGAPLQLLKEAVITANNKIAQERAANSRLERMSCVMSVAILDAEKEMMYIAHVGDSRGYVYRNGELYKITKDHSTVGIKEDNGLLTEEEAMHHPRRNEINKMMGELMLDTQDSGQYFDIKEHSFLPDDIVLFCSDGLTDLVTKAAISDILSQHEPLQKKVQRLIDAANALGGKDNITVALATYSVPKKPGRKRSDKNTIELPVAEKDQSIERMYTSSKKKIWLLPVVIAFITGFLVNWPGTKSFFHAKQITVDVDTLKSDTSLLQLDSLGMDDSLNGEDTLINTTDTIYKDSMHNALQGY